MVKLGTGPNFHKFSFEKMNFGPVPNLKRFKVRGENKTGGDLRTSCQWHLENDISGRNMAQGPCTLNHK